MDRNVASPSIIIIACFLLVLYPLITSARTPFEYLTGFDTDHTTTNHDSFPVSADPNAIFLPSEKPEPETNSKVETATESSEASNKKNPRRPFTVFSFSRSRIRRRPLPSSFRPVHRCHHHHQQPYRPWNRHLPDPRRGNDVVTNIKSIKDNIDKDFDPGELIRFGHVEPKFSRERRMANEKSELSRRLYSHRNRQRRLDPAHEPQKKDAGFVKRIRKFLNRF